MLLTNFLIITGAQCILNAKVIITVNFSTLSKTEQYDRGSYDSMLCSSR